jgi:hypothetical protein
MTGLLCPATLQELVALELTRPAMEEEEPPRPAHLPRELLILGGASLVGFLVVPFLIWTVGHSALGPYTHGGWVALWKDFMAGLAHGSPVFWAVALGPYLFVVLVRLLYAQGRRRSPDHRELR